MDEYTSIPSSQPTDEINYNEYEQGKPAFVPSETNLKPSELFGTRPAPNKVIERANESTNELLGSKLIGESDDLNQNRGLLTPANISQDSNLLTPDDLKSDNKVKDGELLGSSSSGGLLTGETELKLLPEEGKFSLLNKIINQFIKYCNNVDDSALCMFDGLVLSQTFDWDISADIKRVINEWKEESTSIFLKGTKYATLKVGDDVLVATSTQGKGHLLCISINEDLFIIFVLDKTADPLTIFDDFEPYNEQLRSLL